MYLLKRKRKYSFHHCWSLSNTITFWNRQENKLNLNGRTIPNMKLSHMKRTGKKRRKRHDKTKNGRAKSCRQNVFLFTEKISNSKWGNLIKTGGKYNQEPASAIPFMLIATWAFHEWTLFPFSARFSPVLVIFVRCCLFQLVSIPFCLTAAPFFCSASRTWVCWHACAGSRTWVESHVFWSLTRPHLPYAHFKRKKNKINRSIHVIKWMEKWRVGTRREEKRGNEKTRRR